MSNGYTHIVIAVLISVLAISLVGVAWYYEAEKEKCEEQKSDQTSSMNTNTDAADSAEVASIRELKEMNPSSGLYTVEGYVVQTFYCPPCPTPGQCIPCEIEDNFVIADGLIADWAGYDAIPDDALVVYTDDLDEIEEGGYYSLTMEFVDFQSLADGMNDARLVSIEKLVVQ